jgi:hypothetical protein
MKEVDTMTNTSNRKPTKRDHFNALLAIPAVAENADLVAFIEHEVELLDKKNSAERKPTPKQTENVGIKNAIVEWMESDTPYLSADVVKGCPACEGLSAQRVSALLSQLVADGTLIRTEDKRKNYYSLA